MRAGATSFVTDVLPADTGRAGERRVTAQQLDEISMLRRVLEVGAGTQEVRKLIIAGELLRN